MAEKTQPLPEETIKMISERTETPLARHLDRPEMTAIFDRDLRKS